MRVMYITGPWTCVLESAPSLHLNEKFYRTVPNLVKGFPGLLRTCPCMASTMLQWIALSCVIVSCSRLGARMIDLSSRRPPGPEKSYMCCRCKFCHYSIITQAIFGTRFWVMVCLYSIFNHPLMECTFMWMLQSKPIVLCISFNSFFASLIELCWLLVLPFHIIHFSFALSTSSIFATVETYRSRFDIVLPWIFTRLCNPLIPGFIIHPSFGSGSISHKLNIIRNSPDRIGPRILLKSYHWCLNFDM